MEEIIKWIIENKELVVLACITISVSIPVSMHFGKTIINNNIKKNNTTNNYNNFFKKRNSSKTVSKPKNEPRSKYKGKSTDKSVKGLKAKKTIELINIRLYSTGKKGKVYTNNFYKSMNHNFGVEIKLRNNTSLLQNVKVGWCIYKKGKEIMKGTFNKKVNANGFMTTDFYVEKQAFNDLRVGKYESKFWVNDQRVQKVYFTISNK